MPRQIGKGCHEGLSRIGLALGDKCISCLLKQIQDRRVHLVQVLYCVTRRSLYNILWLGNSNLLENNTGSLLDILDQRLVFLRVESDACAFSSSSSCSTRSMNVCFDILGRLNLDNEINVGYVDAS